MLKASDLEDVSSIQTGLFIDKLTGVHGIPIGYITELFGDAGIGKSSLCLQVVSSAQKTDLKCLWVDAEWSYSPLYAKNLGCRNEEIGIIRERDAEGTLDAVVAAIESKKWNLIVLDSVGGLTPRAEIEKGAEGKVIGAQAGLLARFCRKAIPLLSLNKVALIVINHSFIDIMSGKLSTSGGKKLSYHKSISIRLKQKQGVVLKSGETKVGKVVIGEVRKNKLAATEGMELDGHFIFGQGFSKVADLLADAIDRKIVTKKGNTFFLEETKLGVGLTAARKFLDGDEALQVRLKELLK